MKADAYLRRDLYPIKPGTALITENVSILLNAEFTPIEPSTVTVISAAAKQYKTEEEALNDSDLHPSLAGLPGSRSVPSAP